MKIVKLDLSILNFLFEENHSMDNLINGEFDLTFVNKFIYNGKITGIRELFLELYKQADNGFTKAEIEFNNSCFQVNMLSATKQEITLLALDVILGTRFINAQTLNNDFVILLFELNKCVNIKGPHNSLVQNVLDAVVFNNYDDDDLNFELVYLHDSSKVGLDIFLDIARMHQILQDQDFKDKFNNDINKVLAKNSLLNYYMVYDGDELDDSVIKKARVTFINNKLEVMVYQVFDLYKELDFLADEILRKNYKVTFIETIEDVKGLI